ncbi:hypothetical protein [Paraburkholderia fungorum]|uniref:hypothetical protein n=1 Tax=Paraburkholderia fungorum TaxID=134537 RepID=UPI0038BBD9E9
MLKMSVTVLFQHLVCPAVVSFFAFGGGIFLVLASLAFSCLLIGLLAFPLCGGHLLFFAAAKKSRQKKAAQTANS